MTSNQKNLISIIAALSISGVLVLGMGLDLFGWAYSSPEKSKEISREVIATTSVVRVIDGDTITVRLGTSTQSVRLIGMDTPEIIWPSDENDLEEPAEECYAFAARDYLRDQVDDQTITLVGDSLQPEYDIYDRLLAYVYIDDILINQKLLEEGFAREMTVGDGYDLQDEFRTIEETAREGGVGLWSACVE